MSIHWPILRFSLPMFSFEAPGLAPNPPDLQTACLLVGYLGAGEPRFW